MRRARLGAAPLGVLLLVAGCGGAVSQPPQGAWQALQGAPKDAMTTGVAMAGSKVYLAYATPGGSILLQKEGQRPLALPGGSLGLAAPGSAETPIAAVGESIYVATSDGVVPYVGGGGFGPVRQVRNGTPPVSVSACGGALCFDEIATFDPKTQMEMGPAILARLTAAGLRSLRLPQALRPLPAPLVAAGGQIWLAASPEPETYYVLLAASERSLQMRVVQRFPAALKPIALTPQGGEPAVLLLQQSTGRLGLWHAGRITWVRLPSAARAATGAGIVTLAALPGKEGYLLGLPALPGSTSGLLHQASLWQINPSSGSGRRIALPPAPRRFTAAPALSAQPSFVLAAWQGRYAYFR